MRVMLFLPQAGLSTGTSIFRPFAVRRLMTDIRPDDLTSLI